MSQITDRTLAVGCALLAVLLPCAPTAWAGPPVPVPPPYQVPQWPVPVPGQWQSPWGTAVHGTLRHGTAPLGIDPAARVADAINRRRAEAGCARVRLRTSLNRAAQVHSTDMARHQRLSHSGTNGSGPDDRMRAAGYRPGHTGEAVVAGPPTAGAAVTQWMDSPPHRAIILTCSYTDAGVGVATGSGGPWWTLDLATKR